LFRPRLQRKAVALLGYFFGFFFAFFFFGTEITSRSNLATAALTLPTARRFCQGSLGAGVVTMFVIVRSFVSSRSYPPRTPRAFATSGTARMTVVFALPSVEVAYAYLMLILA
jgi:hypothetical protein